MDHHALPERLADRDEPRVMLALGLIERMIFERLEMKRGREIKRMIGDRATFGLRRCADVTALEIRDHCEKTNFRGEEFSLCRSEILA